MLANRPEVKPIIKYNATKRVNSFNATYYFFNELNFWASNISALLNINVEVLLQADKGVVFEFTSDGKTLFYGFGDTFNAARKKLIKAADWYLRSAQIKKKKPAPRTKSSGRVKR